MGTLRKRGFILVHGSREIGAWVEELSNKQYAWEMRAHILQTKNTQREKQCHFSRKAIPPVQTMPPTCGYKHSNARDLEDICYSNHHIPQW